MRSQQWHEFFSPEKLLDATADLHIFNDLYFITGFL
jgi:hypothetical protein